MKSRSIKVKYLARVEGEGGLYINLKDGAVADVKLRIFEPPRFFEAFLRGRQYSEAPDFTSRICGICPVAYLMSASHAMEDALGVKVTGPTACTSSCCTPRIFWGTRTLSRWPRTTPTWSRWGCG
jgi:sulfhydrogenase subunit alpha